MESCEDEVPRNRFLPLQRVNQHNNCWYWEKRPEESKRHDIVREAFEPENVRIQLVECLYVNTARLQFRALRHLHVNKQREIQGYDDCKGESTSNDDLWWHGDAGTYGVGGDDHWCDAKMDCKYSFKELLQTEQPSHNSPFVKQQITTCKLEPSNSSFWIPVVISSSSTLGRDKRILFGW